MSCGDTRETTVYPSSIVASQKPQPFSKAASLSSDQRLATLNERLEALQRDCLPPAPFLLSIQSRRQYHLSEHQHKDEIKERDCGFNPEEREHQYLSFLNTGWDNTVFTILKPGERINRVDKSQAMASASATPKTVAKKMSIADYKKRSLPPSPAVNGSPAVDDARNRAVSSASHLAQNSASLKRSSDTLGKTKLQTTTNDEPPAKKLKPSPLLGPSDKQSTPSKKKFSLPPPLSPTLPPFVEKLLAKSDTSSPKPKQAEVSISLKKTNPVNEDAKAASRENSRIRAKDGDISNKPLSQTSKPTVNGVHLSTNNAVKPNRPSTTNSDSNKVETKDTTQSTPSVIVRLWIPKDRRKDIARLIRLPPKRIRERTPIPKYTSAAEKIKSDDLSTSTSKIGEKRPREDDTLDVQKERKRSKSPALQDRITGKKPRESTPVAREEVTTPQGAVQTGTPIPPTSASRLGHRHTPSESGSINTQTSERLDGLQKLQTKYSELGRTLKKEGDKLSDPDMSQAQRKKFIASRIEVTLAFILSYAIGDEVLRIKRRPPRPEATWNSLFLWMRSVHELVHDHPHLSGLLLQLEAISLMVVWRQRSELAENSDTFAVDKYKELRAQCEEAQRKFVKGSARLSVDDLQDEFPKTWKMKARHPLAHVGYKMAKDNLNGEFYLPLTTISLPIEGVRAGKTLLAEWCRREGVEWVAKLDF